MLKEPGFPMTPDLRQKPSARKVFDLSDGDSSEMESEMGLSPDSDC